MSIKKTYQKLGDCNSMKSQQRKSQQEVDQHNPQTSTFNVKYSTRKSAHPKSSSNINTNHIVKNQKQKCFK
ncbi:unnamed protein product [Macrosiphum euphorbiae]|uniref:Uncharacterized protein n=1 Tax=Macrosiphum euphorbiae TaxID=13131 RepID=A0AAV0XTD5_9HEMI|nr:unnamed protein product [Macrosiphum euphorbiae]